MHENRARQRSELYSSSRNISLSPAPKVQQVARDDKENFKPPNAQAPLNEKDLVVSSQTANGYDQQSAKISEKESRRKAFALRFLAWKTEKAERERLQKDKLKRAPFVVPTGRAGAAESSVTKTTFAQKSHVFQPPANLKNVTLEVVGKNAIRCVNGADQVIYRFVETPKKKPHSESKISSVKASTSRAFVTKPLVSSKPAVHKTSNVGQKIVIPAAAKFPTPKAVLQCLKPTEAVAPGTSRLPIPNTVQKSLKPTETPVPGPFKFTKPLLAQTNSKLADAAAQGSSRFPNRSAAKTPSAGSNAAKPTALRSKTPIRQPMPPPAQPAPKPLVVKPQSNVQKSKMPPPSQPVTRNCRKPHTSSLATASSSNKLPSSKAGLPPLKRPAFKAAKKASTSISHAVVAMNAKSAKSSAVLPTFKLNGKSFLQSMVETTKLTDPIPETPTDSNPDHSYINFVTSTKRKSSSSKDLRADLLFADLGNTISPVDDVCPAPVDTIPKEINDNKFNFVRYSIVQSEKSEPAKPVDAEKPKPTEEVLITPEKTDAAPTTYMSPYVSVSRGKVNTKIEKEKRNSIYMPPDDKVKSPEASATMRRTIATVRYYRKQLTDEIDRLDAQCYVWEQYKENNAQLIEDGGLDMINVTIGQTKLLTTKKLKQFGGLIDRCEDGVLGRTSICGAGGEGSKLILPEDLEGFWSMVGLQIENVDKRFANLERWKANNWTDPDDVLPKASNGLANAKKTKKRKPVVKARANGGLQKMLKAAHAAYLNKKAVGGGADEDIILTPSKSRQVVIMNRRSRSAAATVITVNTPKRKSSPLFQGEPTTDLNETPKQLPHVNDYRKSVNLLKSTLLSELEKKSPAAEYGSPIRQAVMSRKSILKTPGSISRPKRSVIFNSPSLKFTIEDAVGTPWAVQQQQQEENDKRTYKLRNRRIVLRDSAEFVIPK